MLERILFFTKWEILRESEIPDIAECVVLNYAFIFSVGVCSCEVLQSQNFNIKHVLLIEGMQSR